MMIHVLILISLVSEKIAVSLRICTYTTRLKSCSARRAAHIDKTNNVVNDGVCLLRGYDRVAKVLKKEINLIDPKVTNKIVKKAPSILRNSDSTLQGKIQFFRDTFGFSNQDLQKFIVRGPPLLGMSSETIAGRVSYLMKVFDGNRAAVRSVALRHPTLLTYRVEENMRPKIEYLAEKVFDGNHTALCSSLLQMPALLSRSLEGRIKPRVEALTALGMEPSSCIWAWAIKGTVDFERWLGATVKNEISRNQPKAENVYRFDEQRKFFKDELGLNMNQVLKVLERTPSIFPQSLSNIRSKIEYLRSSLGLSKRELRELILRQPPVLASNVDSRLKPNICFLMDFFGGNITAVRRVVQTKPQLLGLSIPGKLNLTTTYLLEVCENDPAAARDLVFRLPAILSYSLENRLRPRFDTISKMGMNITSMPIASVLTLTDEKFDLWLQKQNVKRAEANNL